MPFLMDPLVRSEAYDSLSFSSPPLSLSLCASFLRFGFVCLRIQLHKSLTNVLKRVEKHMPKNVRTRLLLLLLLLAAAAGWQSTLALPRSDWIVPQRRGMRGTHFCFVCTCIPLCLPVILCLPFSLRSLRPP